MTADGICGRGCGGIIPGIGCGIIGGAAIGAQPLGAHRSGRHPHLLDEETKLGDLHPRSRRNSGHRVRRDTSPLITMPLALPSSMIETPVGSTRTRQ